MRSETSGERFDRAVWSAELNPILALWKKLNQVCEVKVITVVCCCYYCLLLLLLFHCCLLLLMMIYNIPANNINLRSLESILEKPYSKDQFPNISVNYVFHVIIRVRR